LRAGVVVRSGAKQAAQKCSNAVILSGAKDLALSIFQAMRDSSFARLRSALPFLGPSFCPSWAAARLSMLRMTADGFFRSR